VESECADTVRGLVRRWCPAAGKVTVGPATLAMIRYEVSLELGEIDVESSVETQRSRDGTDHLHIARAHRCLSTVLAENVTKSVVSVRPFHSFKPPDLLTLILLCSR